MSGGLIITPQRRRKDFRRGARVSVRLGCTSLEAARHGRNPGEK